MLLELRVSDLAVLQDSGLLAIVGIPQDTTRVLSPGERTRLSLSTSAGDDESFDLGPVVCDGFTLSCHDVSVLMKDGHHVRELFSLLNAVPARVYLAVLDGKGGGVFVFHPERVPGAVAQLASHQAVESAERSNVAAQPPPRKWGQRGGLPLDFRPIVVRDGVLQAQPGDTVVVRYVQPDSTILELTIAIPAP